MYKLLENLIIFSDTENKSLLSETADLCRKAAAGEENLQPEAYKILKKILNEAAYYGYKGNLWQCIVASYIALSVNSFSLSAERKEKVKENSFAVRDCSVLKEMFFYDLSEIDKAVGCDCFEALKDYDADVEPSDAGKIILAFRDDLEVSEDFAQTVTEFYMNKGVGIFGLSKAFTVNTKSDQAEFVPIRVLPDIKLSDLIGYQTQKERLLRNTNAFLKKRPANNVLLFGDGGTGKSTSIRALANQCYDDGLRIIQVYRHQMQFLNQIIAAVKMRNYRFIIYMDDLSFEDFETEYKYLKAVIEGGLEQRPENVLIYATSNRRHLIKETWKDRNDVEYTEDIHRSDSIEEKLSLADRFGVQIYYGKPTREEFHHIVEVLAIKEKLKIDSDVLHIEANKWEVRHGGVSGRSARQFIDYIKGTEDDLK